MRYLYSAFLRPKQSRSATEWHVLTGSHSFYLRPPTRPSWLYSVSIHQMAPPRTRQHSSGIAYCSIYRPRKDERLSWPSWLTCSRRFTHIIHGVVGWRPGFFSLPVRPCFSFSSPELFSRAVAACDAYVPVVRQRRQTDRVILCLVNSGLLRMSVRPAAV